MDLTLVGDMPGWSCRKKSERCCVGYRNCDHFRGGFVTLYCTRHCFTFHCFHIRMSTVLEQLVLGTQGVMDMPASVQGVAS